MAQFEQILLPVNDLQGTTRCDFTNVTRVEETVTVCRHIHTHTLFVSLLPRMKASIGAPCCQAKSAGMAMFRLCVCVCVCACVCHAPMASLVMVGSL